MTESELFRAAINLPASDREEFLLRACGDDTQLLRRIREKLQSNASRVEDEEVVSGEPDDSGGDETGRQSLKARSNEQLDRGLTLTAQSTDVGQPSNRDFEVLRPGDEIGPFKLRQHLGTGGMGEVWKAEQFLPVKRLVALKVIRRGIGSREILARFDAERQALALMNHPNIARILDAGTTADGQPYFAMELVQGKPLTIYCDENKLGINERLELFRDVCDGVQHAHQKGIIHRDLKPGNILVAVYDGKPIAKVIDFGLAKAMESTLKLTDQSLFTGIGQILGTLKYMSPEQASLDLVDIDTRTDIYSLGVILYELLTGTTPLDASSFHEMAALRILEIVRDKEPAKPSSRLSSNSEEQVSTITGKRKTDGIRLKRVLMGDLDWVVMKALEKDRTRRYESASGFAADILRYLRYEPVVARPPSLSYRIKKFVRKNRVGVISALMIVMALVTGIVGTTLGLVRAYAAEEVAERRREEAESERAIAETRRIEAERNLRHAKKGNEILGSVFAKLDPKAEYTNVSELRNALRDNLQTAVDELQGSAVGDPLAVTEMQMVLAKSLISLNETASAIRLLEQVRQTRVDRLGLEHSDTLHSMNVLAWSYLQGGEIDKALDLYGQTWELSKAHLGTDHSGTLNTMGSFASALLSNGQIEKGLQLMEEATLLFSSKLGPDHRDTLSSTNNLATAYHEVGQIDKAVSLYKQVVEKQKMVLGTNHPTTLSSMSNLAWALIDAGQIETAATIFKQTLDQQIAILGADSPETMYTMSGLAATYEESGDMDEAILLYERTLELMKLKLGQDHPDTLSSMSNLAGAYYRADKMDKTVALYEQAVELMNRKLGPDHPNTLMTMSNLALTYQAINAFDKAVPLFEQSLRSIESQQFKSQFAFSMFHSAIESYEAAKRYEQADQWRTTWQTFVREEFGEESLQYAVELESQGSALMLRGEPAKAEPLLRHCLATRKRLLLDNWATFNTQSLLGRCLLLQKKYVESEEELLAAYAGLRSQESTIPHEADPGIIGTLDQLVELYSALDQPESRDRYSEFRDLYRTQ